MNRKSFPCRSIARLLVAIAACSATSAHAQDLSDLYRQYSAHKAAGRLKEAEALALEMVAVSRRDFGDEPNVIATSLENLGHVYFNQRRDAEAEATYKRVLAMREQALDPMDSDIGDICYNLANLYLRQQRYAQAEPLYRRALAIKERNFGANDRAVSKVLGNYALVYFYLGRYADAEKMFQRAARIDEQRLGLENPELTNSWNNLALVYEAQGRYADAEKQYQRVLAVRETQFGKEHPQVAAVLNNLASVYRSQARYAEAEAAFRRALAIRRHTLGEDDPEVAQALMNLGTFYQLQARFDEAEPLLKQAVDLYLRTLGPDHTDTALAIISLGEFDQVVGRLAEAEELLQRSLAIREKALGRAHPEVAASLNDLTNLYVEEERFGAAEEVGKRALAINQAAFGDNHPRVALSLLTLARAYQAQNRATIAEPLLKRSLVIRERFFGSEHPDVAMVLNNLSVLYFYEGRHQEGIALDERAVAIRRKTLPAAHPDLALSLTNLGVGYREDGRIEDARRLLNEALEQYKALYGGEHPSYASVVRELANASMDEGDYGEAEKQFRRAIGILEKAPHASRALLAHSLSNLARLYRYQERWQEAWQLSRRTIEIVEKLGAANRGGFEYYKERALILWGMEKKTEAVAAMKFAIDVAERQRTRGAGGETDRAESFAQFSLAFERMIAWQLELGHHDEAFLAAERSRSRSLADQIELQGADLLAGVPEEEARLLRKREADVKVEVASLRQQLQLANAAAADDSAIRGRLEAELRHAQERLVDVYRDIRGLSPAFQLTVGRDFKPAGLSDVQQWADEHAAAWLQYFVGNNQVWLFVVRAGHEPQATALTIDDEAAAAVGGEAGPLTAERLEQLFQVEGRDLLSLLTSGEYARHATERLAMLWKVIVPEPLRQVLTAGEMKKLVVVPDGPLALVPFETLVVESGDNPRFLLDVGPPVTYAPSATVLFNVSRKSVSAAADDARQPVLTVANPIYATAGQPQAGGTGVLTDVAARGQYRSAGGVLAELPFSGTESAWVAEGFKKHGMTVAALRRDLATEHNVRGNLSDRRVLHFACHGLADQAYGNFFGCLALTPGARAATNPSDDGFLTLPEIYELNLKGCELAILSACQTNYGPQQKGEGVWALSRGFLVAGARRVVASNWLVDDEAAASLISVFCSGIAKAEANGESPDYAAALQRAKRWVRKQPKWASPYYWGTFVLVGPN